MFYTIFCELEYPCLLYIGVDLRIPVAGRFILFSKKIKTRLIRTPGFARGGREKLVRSCLRRIIFAAAAAPR